MSRSSSSLLCLFLLSSILQSSTVEGKVDCYVCSWSPTHHRDTKPRDSCTDGHFNSTVRVHSCENGCESVTVYDKYGVLENVYHNCANKGSTLGCHFHNSTTMRKMVCTCNENYCNSSSQLQVWVSLLFIALTFQLRVNY